MVKCHGMHHASCTARQRAHSSFDFFRRMFLMFARASHLERRGKTITALFGMGVLWLPSVKQSTTQ